MFKIVLAIFLSFIFINNAVSQTENSRNTGIINKPVLCGTAEHIIKSLLSEEINEQPVWKGQSEDAKSEFALFINPKTNTFTIIQYTNQWACILGLGNKSYNFISQRLQL